jgi:hypothetical protein
LFKPNSDTAIKFPSQNIDFTNENGYLVINVPESNFDLTHESRTFLKSKNARLQGSIIYLRVTIENEVHDIPVLNENSDFFDYDSFKDNDSIKDTYQYLTNLENHIDKQCTTINTPQMPQTNSNNRNNENTTNFSHSLTKTNDTPLTKINSNTEHLFDNIEDVSFNDYLDIDPTFNESEFDKFMQSLAKK